MSDHFQKLQQAKEQGALSQALASMLHNFYLSYEEAIQENHFVPTSVSPILNQFLDLVIEQLKHPYHFEPYHHRMTKPVNYYAFGLNLIRPLIDFTRSSLNGSQHLNQIQAALDRGDNVILLSNHQTEPDPQAISLLIEKTHPKLAEEMIFVAGHRVTTDPLAVPFSKGRNLLCIYSKRHMEHPPEEKEEKLKYNQKTMKQMVQLLNEGGKCIYVAPSGGRDRKDDSGRIEIAPFDPQSLEMFLLMASQATPSTHFHTLALSTYDLLPPPSSVESSLGERRHAHCTPIHLVFGPEIDMHHFPGSDTQDKKERRTQRAQWIWEKVVSDYNTLITQRDKK